MLVKEKNAHRGRNVRSMRVSQDQEDVACSFSSLRTKQEGRTGGRLPVGIVVTFPLNQGRDTPRTGEQTKVINSCQSEDKTSL